MGATARQPFSLDEDAIYRIFDDFLEGVDVTNRYALTKTATGGGAGVSAAGVGGILTQTGSSGTPSASDECYLATAESVFQPAGGAPSAAEALISYTEANTNQAGVIFGFASGVGAGLITADAAGLRTTGTIVALYKIAGSLVWRYHVRNGSTFQDGATNCSTQPGGYQKLRLDILDSMSGNSGLSVTGLSYVTFRVDNQILRDANDNWIKPIPLPLSGIAAAQGVIGVKNGSGSKETLNADYHCWWQTRIIPASGP